VSNNIQWLNANDFRRELVADGWHTPDTYDNCYAMPTRGAAVYMFLSFGEDERDRLPDFTRTVVAYVGMSKRLNRRWVAHSVLREIRERSSYMQRWFKPCEADALRPVEAELIQKYDPPWNIQGRKRGIEI
jgi:hypothetical protein